MTFEPCILVTDEIYPGIPTILSGMFCFKFRSNFFRYKYFMWTAGLVLIHVLCFGSCPGLPLWLPKSISAKNFKFFFILGGENNPESIGISVCFLKLGEAPAFVSVSSFLDLEPKLRTFAVGETLPWFNVSITFEQQQAAFFSRLSWPFLLARLLCSASLRETRFLS